MSRPWFHAKRLGIGSGLPCDWRGWVLLLGYFALVFGMFASGFWIREPWLANGVFLVATLIFVWVCAATTEGGWRWRQGGR